MQQNFLFVKVEKNYFRLQLSEILYIQSEKKYVNIVTTTKSYLTFSPISHIEKLLPSTLFCRIHRCYIISLQQVDHFDNDFVYISKRKIPLAENCRSTLKDSVIIINGHGDTVKLNDADQNHLSEKISPAVFSFSKTDSFQK